MVVREFFSGNESLSRFFAFVALGLFLVAWLLPNHYAPWVAVYQDFLSFFSVFIFNLSLMLRGCVYFRSYFLFFLILLAVLVFQALTGVIYFFGDALVAGLYIIGFVSMLIVGCNFSRQHRGRTLVANGLATILIIGSIASLWIALRQWLLLSGSLWVADLPLGGRPFANLAQPNSLATLLCMGLAGVLYLYEKYYFGRLAAGMLTFFLLFGIALTQSRTPWVGAIATTVFWAWKLRLYNSRLPLRGMLLWIGAYLICILTLPVLAEFLLLPGSDPLVRAQSLERWGMWVQFWHAIWQGPIWGYGWNQVSVAQVAVSLVYPVPIMTEHSHNILLDLLLWNGPLLGGLIIFCIIVWLLRLGWQARSMESLFCLIAVGFVLVHGMLEYPLEYAFFLFPLGLLLGVVVGERYSEYEFVLPRWVLGGVLALGGGLFGWIWQEYSVIEDDHRLMRFEAARIGTLKAEHVAPDVVLLTPLREFIRFARTPASENMSAEQLGWMRKVAHRYPFAPSLFRYSLALGLNGQPESALEQLLILRALHGERSYVQSRDAWQQMSSRHPQLLVVLQNLPDVRPL